MGWINGKKTYLGMIGLGVLAICFEMELVDASYAKMLGYAISSWTGVAMVHKYEKKQIGFAAPAKKAAPKK